MTTWAICTPEHFDTSVCPSLTQCCTGTTEFATANHPNVSFARMLASNILPDEKSQRLLELLDCTTSSE